MSNGFKLFCLFFGLLFTSKFSQAQITANPSSGCAPLSVQFSGPAGATNVSWNLGPPGTTTLSNPNPIYASAGTFVVSFSGNVNGSPVTYTTAITVGNPPSASFNYTIPLTHCAPLTASFTASGASQGSTYSWAFGDLTSIATGSSLVHTYNVSGIFSPICIVTDAVTGCTAVATAPAQNSINVSAIPSLSINATNGFVGCAPPFSTAFTASNSVSGSPLGGSLTYIWQISTGTPASGSGANIGPVTFGLGNHTVTLIGKDNNNCSDTITQLVSVISSTLSASVPSVVCIGAPVIATLTASQGLITYTSSAFAGNYSHPWIPGSTDTIITPGVTNPGPQSITFFSTGSPLCPPSSVTKSFSVEVVTASVIPIPPFTSCSHSLIASFTNVSFANTGAPLTFSSGASGWTEAYYHVNPNPVFTNSVSQNITFTMSAGSQNPYSIIWNFSPIFSFVATSINGCKTNVTSTVFDLAPLIARYTRDVRQGCAPLVVNFRDTSYTSLSNPVTSFTWNSGTTPPVIVTNTSSTTFTYSTPGIYIASYTVQTQTGCTDVFADTVYVTTPPTGLSATVPASVCAGVPITLTVTGSAAAPPGLIDHWHIDADKHYFSGCITDNTPTFPFTHIGTNSVSVSAYQWNCGSTVAITSSVEVRGPIGKFVTTNYCGTDKMKATFEVQLSDVSTATLNFGDGSVPVIIAGNLGTDFFSSYSHTYTATGNYTVTLLSSNAVSGCGNYLHYRVVRIRDPKAVIKWNGNAMPTFPAAVACTKEKLKFDGLSSTDNVAECAGGYTWWLNTPNGPMPPLNYFSGLFSTHYPSGATLIAVPAIADTFRLAGNYTISLQVRDVNGCPDRVDVPFRVSSAVPVFTFNSNPVCYSAGSVQVINSTQSSLVSPDVISSYTFSFGNGGVQTSTNPLFNPVNVYGPVPPPSQTFAVMAIAKNQLNCIDTTIHTLQVNNPVTGFMTTNFYPCIPLGQVSNAVPFTAVSGYNTYSFTTGTPTNAPVWQSTSSFSGVTRYYNVPGVYFPTLTVVDAAGCKATDVLTITAYGQPTAVIKNLGVSGYCVPAKIRLVDSSQIFQSPISNYQWSYGNFTSPGSIADTVLENILPTPGSYTMSHIVTVGNGACPSTTKKIINVFDTKAELEIDKTKFCLGDEITVTAKGLKDVYSWKWFFGDLVPQPAIYNTPFAANPITYQYNTYPPGSSDGKTVIFLKAVSDNLEGCVVTKTVAVQVIKIDADFTHTKNTYIHCLGSAVDVFSTTTSNPLNLVYNYTWNFGNNVTANGDTSKYLFPSAGVYTVSMTVKDTAYACKAVAIKNMTILPLPSASLTASDSLVCPVDTFALKIKAESTVPGTLKATLQPKLLQNYALPLNNTYSLALTTTVSTMYKLFVTDTNNCSSPIDSALVKVPAMPTQVNTSTTIVIGQTVTLNAPTDGRCSYYWFPEIKDLSDTTSASPVCSSLSDIMYTVTLVDEPRRCWATPSTFTVIVLPVTSIDVPSAFTPNNDGINDVIFPDGWGIKTLKYFRVYNRWGQLIFETNEYKHGWDGKFMGELQNMDTYVYQVEAETYIKDPSVITKSGTFKLIR